MEISVNYKIYFMNLYTKYYHMADDNENKGKKAGVESTFSKDPDANVGTGPSPNIADGGVEGEAKQPKENTGNSTSMGGASGGISGLADVSSDSNDNSDGE